MVSGLTKHDFGCELVIESTLQNFCSCNTGYIPVLLRGVKFCIDVKKISLVIHVNSVCCTVVLYFAILFCSIQKDPAGRMSASELLVSMLFFD